MRLPAEWEKQDAIQLTWPDDKTPWEDLSAVRLCFVRILTTVQKYGEKVIMVARDVEAAADEIAHIASSFGIDLSAKDIIFVEAPLNDTWARDYAGISVYSDKGEKILYDFNFNAWGQKFPSNFDNQITKKVFAANIFSQDVKMGNMAPFVLEGGSIDSDGSGSLLTTTECLTSVNRNEYLNKEEIRQRLSSFFGLRNILYLDYGSLIGDDTDSHVDVLARFCSEDTIAYSSCANPLDENYNSLKDMEQQLQSFRSVSGEAYKLIALPIPEPMYLDGYRLPASYANFLIINGAVLMPTYNSKYDDLAKAQLQKAFPSRVIETIDCYPLLSGHGSLHCVTMQYPHGWIKKM